VVGVDEGHSVLFGEADVLLLAQFVFAGRVDVAAVEEGRGVGVGLVRLPSTRPSTARSTSAQQTIALRQRQRQRRA